MKKALLSLAFVTLSLMADFISQPIDQPLLDSKIKIIDIRTPNEWKETGLVKGSIPIMFFDNQGNYDMKSFLDELNKNVKKNERFALICATGSRSQMLGNHLANKLGYDVIDLKWGIQYAIVKKVPLEPYKPKP
jgi:rhodanese-related sulfurtransferase